MGIAHQISLRIENTRLIEEAAHRHSLERELVMARDIQASFLPRDVPEVPGWEVGVTWRSAREVGGDFYDFIPLPEGPHGTRWGIIIADVSDKGIPAALYMALSRTLIRTVASDNVSPADSLERVNYLLLRDTRADLFVSMFYCVWEPQIDRFTYANAGHNPPLLLTPGYASRLVDKHGIVLGVEDGAKYSDHSIALDIDQMLVLYTDGVTEAFNSAGEMFGLHRLENLILGSRNWQAQTVADRIRDRVLNFSGIGEISDDLTAIALRRTLT
jgi:sigma-B regulation protein RsbU (phosphoserine phosphatase)